MFKRIKEIFEKLAYAGLKPQGGRPVQAAAAPKADSAPAKSLGAFKAWFDSKLNKGGNVDPLYLSNRTPMQRAKAWALPGAVVLIALGAISLVLYGYFEPDDVVAPPPVGLTNAEIAAKMLPDLNKDLHIETQHDLDIQDVHVVTGPSVHLAGVAKNNTNHEITKAELTFDLTDKTGSRQGAVSTELKNIGSGATVPFQIAIEARTASFALVREVRVQ
jgi:hypothetical protein